MATAKKKKSTAKRKPAKASKAKPAAKKKPTAKKKRPRAKAKSVRGATRAPRSFSTSLMPEEMSPADLRTAIYTLLVEIIGVNKPQLRPVDGDTPVEDWNYRVSDVLRLLRNVMGQLSIPEADKPRVDSNDAEECLPKTVNEIALYLAQKIAAYRQ